jgi:hypothetical protein
MGLIFGYPYVTERRSYRISIFFVNFTSLLSEPRVAASGRNLPNTLTAMLLLGIKMQIIQGRYGMKKIFVSLFIMCVSSFVSFAHAEPIKIKRVLFITVDGVRWQDVFLDHSHFSKLWSKYASSARIYGEPNSKNTMQVASIAISLPSYQSMTSGSVQPCPQNDCGRITVPTFPELLVKKLGFQPKDVATISSWLTLQDAIESEQGVTFTNCGTVPMVDPVTHQPDEVMDAINKVQTPHHPWMDTRQDKYTLAQALHYLEKYQPRFLWVYLGDADDFAHEDNLPAYNEALAIADDGIDQLLQMLKKLNIDEETLVIVTTDHGRGNGPDWIEHGEEYPESTPTWAFVWNGELLNGVKEGNVTHFSTLSIRPTVEKVFY